MKTFLGQYGYQPKGDLREVADALYDRGLLPIRPTEQFQSGRLADRGGDRQTLSRSELEDWPLTVFLKLPVSVRDNGGAVGS